MSTRGIVYIVDGVFHDLLRFSLHTLRQLPEHASLPVTIYTFQDLDVSFASDVTQVCRVNDTINGVALGSEPNRRHRILRASLYAGLSPYDTTLCLDADTLVYQDVSPLFNMVEQTGVDVAAVSEPYFPGIEPLRYFFGWPDAIDEISALSKVSELLEIDYPNAVDVPYFNAGVICGRAGPWGAEWLRLLTKLEDVPNINTCDSQLPLQAAIIRVRPKYLLLSPAWNFSFRTHEDTSGDQWRIVEGQECMTLRSPNGTTEPVIIHHAIGGIHWMPSILAFLPNLSYIDSIRKILAGQ
jgi:hypothetical protein